MHKYQLTFELEFPYIGGKQTPDEFRATGNNYFFR